MVIHYQVVNLNYDNMSVAGSPGAMPSLFPQMEGMGPGKGLGNLPKDVLESLEKGDTERAMQQLRDAQAREIGQAQKASMLAKNLSSALKLLSWGKDASGDQKLKEHPLKQEKKASFTDGLSEKLASLNEKLQGLLSSLATPFKALGEMASKGASSVKKGLDKGMDPSKQKARQKSKDLKKAVADKAQHITNKIADIAERLQDKAKQMILTPMLKSIEDVGKISLNMINPFVQMALQNAERARGMSLRAFKRLTGPIKNLAGSLGEAGGWLAGKSQSLFKGLQKIWPGSAIKGLAFGAWQGLLWIFRFIVHYLWALLRMMFSMIRICVKPLSHLIDLVRAKIRARAHSLTR